MKALKGLLIYIGIVLGSIVGLALILLCVMYFVPSFRIAGIGFVHKKVGVDEQVVELSEYGQYDDLVVNLSTNKVGIKVNPVDNENLSYSMSLGVFGLTTEIVEYKVVKSITFENNVVQIYLNVTEPKGWVSVGSSCLTLNVPKDLKIGIVANSDSGDINIGSNSESITIDDLNVSTEKGDLSIVNLGHGSEEKNLTLNTMSLSTGSGIFDMSSIDNLTVLNTVKLTATEGRFIFKKLYASVSVTGNGVKLEAEQISCGKNGFSFVADSGYFDIGLLSSPAGAENTIIAEHISRFDVDEIQGKTGIVTSYGDISIEYLRDYAIIENENGNVDIKVANDNISITSKLGNINVESYYATGVFNNNKGEINVNSKGDFNEEYYTQINSIDGNVKIYNEVNRLLLTTTGRANVDITFGKVKEGKVFQHKVNTSTQGKCVIYMPTVNVPAYSFTAKGIISGEIGVKIVASESKQYYPNSTYKNDSVDNCSFEFVGRIEFKGYSQLTN